MKTPRCPVCGKPTDSTYRPFCSCRCADVDLQRWLAGRYAIGGTAEEDQEQSGQSGEEG